MKARELGRLMVMAGLAAMSQVQAESSEDAVQRGTAHYLFFCANCHGADGTGNGPLAVHLKIVPSNLTLLQASGSGEGVADRVMKAIDGRHPVGESGEHKMPIFSDNLEVKTVIEITEYLKTIQK